MFVLSAVVSPTLISLCQLAPGDHFDIAQGVSGYLHCALSFNSCSERWICWRFLPCISGFPCRRFGVIMETVLYCGAVKNPPYLLDGPQSPSAVSGGENSPGRAVRDTVHAGLGKPVIGIRHKKNYSCGSRSRTQYSWTRGIHVMCEAWAHALSHSLWRTVLFCVSFCFN
jgi:hypothetical protein